MSLLDRSVELLAAGDAPSLFYCRCGHEFVPLPLTRPVRACLGWRYGRWGETHEKQCSLPLKSHLRLYLSISHTKASPTLI